MSNTVRLNSRFLESEIAKANSPFKDKAKEQARIYLTHVSRRETRVSRFR